MSKRSSIEDKKKGGSKLQTLCGREVGSVVYMVYMKFPPNFLPTIKQRFYQNADDRYTRPHPLHIRLGATKIGQSSSVERFLKKMKVLRTYLPFADVEFIAIVIPPNPNFNSKQAEQALHFIFMILNICGEWFDMSEGGRAWIVERMRGLGCTPYQGTVDPPQLRLDGTSNGPAGHVYFAKVKWNNTDIVMINSLVSDFTLTCNNLLSVKIGCGRIMERGEEDDDYTDSDDEFEYEDEESDHIDYDEHTKWRGGQYVWS